jgi:hypothetical protein
MPKKEDYAEAPLGLSHLPKSREQQQAARDRRLKMTILKIAMLASVLVTSPAAAFAQAAPEGHSQAYVASYRAPEGSSQPYVASYIAPEQNYNTTITG